MNAPAFLAAADRLAFADIAAIVGGRGLLVLAPHPDDESIGCGGLIVAACAAGHAVHLVVISDGVGSHPNSKTHPPAVLRALREEETLEAASILGLPRRAVEFLRLPDRSVPTTGPEAAAACASIVAAARAVDAGAVLATWGRDPHCDHEATALLAREACHALPDARLFFYPVWGWTLGVAVDVGAAPRGFRFDATPHFEAKLAAVAAHRSQTTDLIADDPDGFRLTPQMIKTLARPHEILLDAWSDQP